MRRGPFKRALRVSTGGGLVHGEDRAEAECLLQHLLARQAQPTTPTISRTVLPSSATACRDVPVEANSRTRRNRTCPSVSVSTGRSEHIRIGLISRCMPSIEFCKCINNVLGQPVNPHSFRLLNGASNASGLLFSSMFQHLRSPDTPLHLDLETLDGEYLRHARSSGSGHVSPARATALHASQ